MSVLHVSQLSSRLEFSRTVLYFRNMFWIQLSTPGFVLDDVF